MFTPLILFLGLTVATAVIAHWSDNLGKKLGKKRVSLFGLRPRTTATILTIASSWVIMLVTLAVLLGAVAPLRNALFSYDRERAQANRDREESRLQIEATQKRLRETQNQVKAANAQLDAEQRNLKKAVQEGRTRTAQARKQATEAEKQATEAQKRVGEAQKRFNEAQTRFVAAQRREAAARKGESEAQGETEKARRETRAAQREKEDARRATELARVDLSTAQNQLQGTKRNLNAAQINLRSAQSSAFEANQAAFRAGRETVKAAKLQIAAERKLNETRSQVDVLLKQRRDLEILAVETTPLLRGDAPVKAGQTFAARLITANQTPSAIAIQLREMLKQAREKFAENEELTPTFPPTTTLQLLPLTERDASGKRDLQGEGLLQFLARRIAGSNTSVRLIAPRNYSADAVRIGLIFLPVPLAPAFAEGEILASATIDGAQGDARIFRSLLDLLDLGQREAEKRGVNPPQSPDEPNFYAEGTNVRLFAALRRIEGSKARLSVNLVAAKALSTVEPLQVLFEIEGDLGASTSGVSDG